MGLGVGKLRSELPRLLSVSRRGCQPGTGQDRQGREGDHDAFHKLHNMPPAPATGIVLDQRGTAPDRPQLITGIALFESGPGRNGEG